MLRKNTIRVTVFVLLIVSAAVLVRIGSHLPEDTGDDANTPYHILPPERQVELPDFTLTPVRGRAFKLSAAVARGPVVLDFWATYCGPCRMELPDLEAIRARYVSRGVQFYAINASDSPETIRRYAAYARLSIPMLVDRRGAITTNLGLDGLPNTIIVDRRRKVVCHLLGYDERMNKHLPKALDKILGGAI